MEVFYNLFRVIIKRYFKLGKFYDGFEFLIEFGDYVIIEFEVGKWWFVYRYYDKNGNLKGEYYNINMFVEIYFDGVCYVDFEVDIVKWLDGKKEIID